MPESKPASRQANRRGASADKRKPGSRQNSADSRREKANGANTSGKKETSPPEDLGPLLDSHSVLEHFSREHAGTSPFATMLKEFASRLMMLFDVGADSGANFSEYWEMMLQVRAEGHAPELRGLGPLFRFVYQHVYAAEHAAEVSRTEQLHVSKAEQQRNKIADQVTTSLAKVQKSLDALLQQSRQGTSASLQSTHSRAALDGVLQDLEGLQETHLDQLNIPVTAVDHALSKTRDAVMTANMSRKAASPRRSAPQSPSRQPLSAPSGSGLPPKVPHVPSVGTAAVSLGSDEARMLPVSARGVPASPSSRRLGHHASPHTARQPHPSLPAVRCEVRSVKSQQQSLELPLRPFASPFGIPAQFDVQAFEAVATERRKHREWLRSRASREHALASIQSQQQQSPAGSSPQSSPAGIIHAAAASHVGGAGSGYTQGGGKRPAPPAANAAASMQSARIAAATATTVRDEGDVMRRLKELRADVIGPESDAVVMTGPNGKRTLPAVSKPPTEAAAASPAPVRASVSVPADTHGPVNHPAADPAGAETAAISGDREMTTPAAEAAVEQEVA